MKKQPFPALLVLTALFAAFTIGLYLGRNLETNEIRISGVSTSAVHSVPITEPGPLPETDAAEPVFPIHINTASALELAQLPGIGEMLARRIVAYREANGAFAAPEELLNVEGIGTGKLEAILTLITTGG